MPATVKVKYFNSFWIKKVLNQQSPARPIWPGRPWNPTGYPTFPGNAKTTSATDNWILEESRIKGGYNNSSISLGVKAFINEEDPIQERRGASVIFSGIFNSKTGNNDTNVFSLASPISKDLNPGNGSIQKLYAEDTNLIILQELKSGYLLINKNTIYTGDQGAAERAGIPTLGQYVPFAGEYGISKDPQSFAQFGTRKYYTDKNRGVVLRLSRDGITEISQYGMKDYFRDNLQLVSDSSRLIRLAWTFKAGQTFASAVNSFNVTCDKSIKVLKGSLFQRTVSNVIETQGVVTNVVDTGTTNEMTITLDRNVVITGNPGNEPKGFFQYSYKGLITGGYDNFSRNYTLSLQQTPNYIDQNNYSTLSFDESIKGWVSFYTYKPSFITSINGKFYSITGNNIYEHYSGSNYMNFYNNQGVGNVQFVFNTSPSLMKNFKTISYEGDNGWNVNVMTSGSNKYNRRFPLTTPIAYSTDNKDETVSIASYESGRYTDPRTGQEAYAGFTRKENQYVANLVNDSIAAAGEIRFGNKMTGIKGYFAKVSFSTDQVTDIGGPKEIWSLSSEVVRSS
tara:strand:+ start:399 stop:2096 length:1698 start_codon:yes stop_codon:yes gene_type:complete